MSLKILQINTNHSRPAQDAAYRYALDRDMAVICISEPHNIPQNYQHIGAVNGLAAIYWNPRIIGSTVTNLKIKRNYVIIRIDNLVLVSMYEGGPIST